MELSLLPAVATIATALAPLPEEALSPPALLASSTLVLLSPVDQLVLLKSEPVPLEYYLAPILLPLVP